MDNVFITGATGGLGRRVIKYLVNNGSAVTALSRSEGNSKLIWDLGARPVMADLFSSEELTECTKGIGVIMHLATSIPRKAIPNKPSDWQMNDRIRIEGTKTLLKAARSNQIKYLIQPSITYVYGNRHGETVNSESSLGSRLPFMFNSAVEMERIIRAEKRLNHIILRFGSFYSADSVSTINMIQNVKNRRMPIIGNGEYFWNNIHVDDAANAVFYVFNNLERLENRTINFTDFTPMTFKDMMMELSELTNSKKPSPITFSS